MIAEMQHLRQVSFKPEPRTQASAPHRSPSANGSETQHAAISIGSACSRVEANGQFTKDWGASSKSVHSARVDDADEKQHDDDLAMPRSAFIKASPARWEGIDPDISSAHQNGTDLGDIDHSHPNMKQHSNFLDDGDPALANINQNGHDLDDLPLSDFAVWLDADPAVWGPFR